jgi:transcriptional regulator with XRE-family HTH domain
MNQGYNDLIKFGKRVAEARGELKIKQKDFADALNVGESTLSLIETGKTKPGYHFFQAIVEKFNVNPVYLFTGKGEIFITEEALKTKEEKDYGEFTGVINDLYYYLENSPMTKFALLEFFKNYQYTHREVMEEDVKEYLAAKEKKKNQKGE